VSFISLLISLLTAAVLSEKVGELNSCVHVGHFTNSFGGASIKEEHFGQVARTVCPVSFIKEDAPLSIAWPTRRIDSLNRPAKVRGCCGSVRSSDIGFRSFP
jgi:hypothetical protein